MCNFLHSPVTSSLLGPNITLGSRSHTPFIYDIPTEWGTKSKYKTTGEIIVVDTTVLGFFGKETGRTEW